MRKHISTVAVTTLLLLSAPARVSADELAPAAEKLVQQSIGLRRGGRDREALQQLEKAESLAPSSLRIVVHLANTHQALGNWLEAAEYLERALQSEKDEYVARHQKTLEKAFEVVSRRIGRVEIGGAPAGAEVRLSGRLIGTLPMAEPARATVGDYTLEVSHPGYYPASRPLSVRPQGLVRESVDLREVPAGTDPSAEGAAAGAESARPGRGDVGVEQAAASDSWLPWGLGVASGVAAATGLSAWVIREQHAERYNDDTRCYNVVGQTRDELCGSEREAAGTAQTVAVVSGVTAVLMAAGAVFVGVGGGSAPAAAAAGKPRPPLAFGNLACDVLVEGVRCSGSF